MSTTTPEEDTAVEDPQGTYQESYAAQRFPAWVALTVFSAIALIAVRSNRGAPMTLGSLLECLCDIPVEKI